MTRKLIAGVLVLLLMVFVFVTYVAVLRTDYRVTSAFVNISMVVLFSFLVLLIIRFFILIYLAYLHHLDRSKTPDYLAEYINHKGDMTLPSVSIIVPAYNEGVVIEGSIRSMLNIQYPALEVIVVDDGSTDDTFARARRYEGRHGNTVVRVFRKENGGKGDSLNYGIKVSSGELVLTVDADSRLEPASLLYAVQHFKDERVGAVAGSALRGAKVIAVDISDVKLETAGKVGADFTINSKNKDLHDELRRILGKEQPGVVVEAAGNPVTYRQGIEELAFTGRMVCIGYSKSETSFSTSLWVKKELDILGSRNATPGDFQAVISLLRSGTFPVKEVVTRVVSIDEVPKVFKQWSDNPQAVLKIMLKF